MNPVHKRKPFVGDGAAARWHNLAQVVLQGLLRFDLQHVLTIFTMAIGSMALAATLFVGEGALSILWQDLDRLLGDRVFVYPDLGPNGTLLGRRPTADLTTADLKYVKAHVVKARYVVPMYFGRHKAAYEDRNSFMTIEGIPAELESAQIYRPMAGRSFSEAGKRAQAYECLITEAAARFLQVKIEEGPTIRVEERRFHVMGIVPDPPEADLRFRPRIIIPHPLAQLLWSRPGVVETIVVSWRSPLEMEGTIKELRVALDTCRAPDAYFLSSSQFSIHKRKNIVANMMLFGSAQALFCILIASIGIINVMLANVVHRTREFAIRVVMGAPHLDIMILVLAESCMMGLVGAAIGILSAALISPRLCSVLAGGIAEASELVPSIGAKGILIPLAVCSLSGFAAGIIPALRVRRLDILAVLRAE